MKVWIMGLYEFFLRYKTIWLEVWRVRKDLDPPKRQADEYQFLPAHLELIETPVSKKPRLAAYLIMLCLCIALLISIFGKVEIVAVANGNLTFSGRSKEIKPIETALVQDILVKEGQFVKKGQALINLSALGSESDLQKAQSSLALSKLEHYRYETLLKAIDTGVLPILDLSGSEYDSVSEADKTRVKNLIQEQFTTWQNQKQQKILSYEHKEIEKQTVSSYIRKYESADLIESEKLRDYQGLIELQAISKHELLAQESKVNEIQSELAVQRSKLSELDHDLLHLKKEIDLVTQLFKSDVLEKLKQYDDNQKQLSFDVDRSEQRQRAAMIKAPVSGTVQQLNVHTVGGVVTTAETLMVITPEADDLEVAALIQNKDIGFVKPSQEAIVKVEAYPYSRYGYLTGKVKHISHDAIEHPQLGHVFSSVISLDNNKLIDAQGNEIELTSGMTATVEIKTGMRSVISYLLSPLEESFSESLKER